jgi:betaine lipid synthase
MSEFVNVPEFFSSVYLVDFSPSLCEVARKRFARLGWTNVKVICEDARKFRLEDYENGLSEPATPSSRSPPSYFDQRRPEHGGADLITMSYSLSMIVRTCAKMGVKTATNKFAARLLLGHRLADVPSFSRWHHGCG